MKNPWIIHSSKYIYEDHWMKVRLDDSELVEKHLKSNHIVIEKPPFTSVLPLLDDETCVLVGQVRYALDKFSWETPMGYLEKEEDPLDGVKRELQEETGYAASLWKSTGVFFPVPAWCNQPCYTYVAEGLSSGAIQHDETEHLEMKAFPFAKVLEMVERGEIYDGPSIVTILKAKSFILDKK